MFETNVVEANLTTSLSSQRPLELLWNVACAQSSIFEHNKTPHRARIAGK